MKNATLAILTGLLAATASVASAAEGAAPAMPLGRAVSAPLGFAELCERAPTECASPQSSMTSSDVRAWAAKARWAAIFSDNARLAPATSYARWRYEGAVETAETFQVASTGSASAGSAPGAPASRRRFWQRDGQALPQVIPVSAPAAHDTDVNVAAVGEERVAVAQGVVARADMRLLSRINDRMNRNIVRASDSQLYGRKDYWAAPGEGASAGDCEDYVLAKRHALLEAGVAAEALSIALARTSRGEMHAVLLVATEDGEVVLDNLTPWIDRWDRAPYEWVERQVAGSPLDWVRIDVKAS